VIGEQRLRSIRKSHCRAVVSKVTERGSLSHAGKVLGLLKQLLTFAENVEDDFTSPATNLKAANLGVEHNVRTRWLAENEISALWRALDEPGPGETDLERRKLRAALRILLLTAVRTGELRLAAWEDVDLKALTWTIPVANQKLSPKHARSGKPFVVPISPTAASLFEDLRKLGNGSPWVLASTSSKDGRYDSKSIGKAMRRLWRSHADLSKLPEASPHDLRRTARTWIGKLGVAPHIAERCLNHRLGRIVDTYDQHDYLSERRHALELWADKLRAITLALDV
jgi:integrase